MYVRGSYFSFPFFLPNHKKNFIIFLAFAQTRVRHLVIIFFSSTAPKCASVWRVSFDTFIMRVAGAPCGKFDAFPRARLCVCVCVSSQSGPDERKKKKKSKKSLVIGLWLKSFHLPLAADFDDDDDDECADVRTMRSAPKIHPFFFFGSSYRVSGHIMNSSTHMRRTLDVYLGERWCWRRRHHIRFLGFCVTYDNIMMKLSFSVVRRGCQSIFYCGQFSFVTRGRARRALVNIIIIFFFAFHACRCARQNLKLNWQLALSHE